MDRVSIMIDRIFAEVEKRRSAMEKIAKAPGLDETETLEFKRLTNQAELLMRVAMTLHESEAKTIRGIWGETS